MCLKEYAYVTRVQFERDGWSESAASVAFFGALFPEITRWRKHPAFPQNKRNAAAAYAKPAAAISACVLGSKLPSPESICLAIALPSSTPNWSNGLMPISTALAKVRCS